jgi:YqaJ-like viral recombinase domain
MLRHDCIQGSADWTSCRSGIPTASNFDKIVTPKGKPSTQADKYMHRLLAERMMGHPVTEFMSTWMGRGLATEAEAVAYYEGIRELETVPVGLLTNDEATIGASPDRLVGDVGLLEIKVPAEHTHVGYLLTRAVDAEYYPQVQGQLWISEREWLDIMSYHPELPPALIRVERDPGYIDVLSCAVWAFSEALEAKAAELRERGWIAPGPAVPASAIVTLYDRAEPVDEAVLASAWQHYSARDKAAINAARARRSA